MLKVFTTLYGKKKLIPEEQQILRLSVFGIVLSGDRILLVNTKSTGKWWFPGGVSRKNEDQKQTVIREVEEETGMEIIVKQKLADVESYFYYDPLQEAYKQVSTFFTCIAKDDSLVGFTNPDLSDEADNPQWISIPDLKEEYFQDYGWQILQLAKNRKE